jgi:hypothetical protein
VLGGDHDKPRRGTGWLIPDRFGFDRMVSS